MRRIVHFIEDENTPLKIIKTAITEEETNEQKSEQQNRDSEENGADR